MKLMASLLSLIGLHPTPAPPDDSVLQQAFRDVQVASDIHERVTSQAKMDSLNRMEISSHDRRPAQMVDSAKRLSHLTAQMLDRLH